MKNLKELLLILCLLVIIQPKLISQKLSVYEVDEIHQKMAFNTLSSNSSSSLSSRIISDKYGKGKIDFKTAVASGDSLVQNLQYLLSGGGNFMLEYTYPLTDSANNNYLFSLLSETRAAYSPSITGGNQIFNFSKNFTARAILKSSKGDVIINPNVSIVFLVGNDDFINIFEEEMNRDNFIHYYYFELNIVISDTILFGTSFTTKLFGNNEFAVPVDVTLSYKID